VISAAALAGTALPGSALPAGASPSWRIVASQNASTAQDNFIDAVTCTSTTDCWAAGDYFNGTNDQTLVEHFDGTAWSVVTSPNTSTMQDNFLVGVSCPAAANCWAAGYYLTAAGARTLIERYNGTSWSIVNSPNRSTTKDDFLVGVTCAAPGTCWAVGDYSTGSRYQTLIEHFNGTVWDIAGSANTSAIQDNVLSGVACASTINCWAGGSYRIGATEQTLIEHFDGAAWRILKSPNTRASQHNELRALSCTSTTNCWAAGDYFAGTYYQTLIERYTGSSWSVANSQDTSPTQDNVLNSVVCTSSMNCWATGDYFSGTRDQTLIERYNGTGWKIVASPNTDPMQDNVIIGVTCTSAASCWAAGIYDDGTNAHTLIEHLDASRWTIDLSPNVRTPADSRLRAVTCASTARCWAVGDYSGVSNIQTLIEQYDGTAWSMAIAPDTAAAQDNVLNSVACTSTTSCWAAGYYNNDTNNQTLIEWYNGTAWSVFKSPNTNATQNNALVSVTCRSAADCWAAGHYNNGTYNQTLIEHFNGKAWSIISSPNIGTARNNQLAAITCTTATNCWAVGAYNGGSDAQTLIEHFNGAGWTIVSSPNTSTGQRNLLLSVTCAATTDCWSAGYYNNGTRDQTLIEHFNGTAWKVERSPDTSSTQNNQLRSVTCAATGDCLAAGVYNNGSQARTLVEHFNGAAWSIAGSPNTSTSQDNLLLGVACASTGNCWATGYYNSGTNVQTLVERG